MPRLLLLFCITVFSFSCKTRYITYNDPTPQHDSLRIFSKHVNEERVINIWTPPNYQNHSGSFPVLYMPDGGIKEDFPHIANTLAKLIAEQKIPPYILVGIENTERGRDLTGYSEAEYDKQFCPMTDGAKNFRAFISTELIPEINNRYKTQDKKGIIGESLAGLFVVETFFLAPEVFDFHIAMDPSLWWNNHFLARNADSLISSLPNKRMKLWFAGSDAKDISRYTKLMELSLQKTTKPKLNWKYCDEPKEHHHTIFRATKEKALIWSLNNE